MEGARHQLSTCQILFDIQVRITLSNVGEWKNDQGKKERRGKEIVGKFEPLYESFPVMVSNFLQRIGFSFK